MLHQLSDIIQAVMANQAAWQQLAPVLQHPAMPGLHPQSLSPVIQGIEIWDHHLGLYLPNIDPGITQDLQHDLTHRFTGFSAFPIQGGWGNQRGQVEFEEVLFHKAFTTQIGLQTHLPDFLRKVSHIGQVLQQEAMLVEVGLPQGTIGLLLRLN